MSASRLNDLQSVFCKFLLRGLHEDQIAAQLRPPSKQQAAQRLDVYRNGYFTRLEKALAHDFPVSERTWGQKRFARLAGDYVLAQPSRYPSLRNIGHGFADWLRIHAGTAIADLADIEWAIMTVFDGPDCTTVESDRMNALTPNDWANMCVTFVPTLTLLSLTSNADVVWRERGEGRKLEHASSRCVGISRGEQFRPILQDLDATSFAVLDALSKEPYLAVMSKRLAQLQDPDKIPDQIATALHIALANHWVAAVSTSNSETGL